MMATSIPCDLLIYVTGSRTSPSDSYSLGLVVVHWQPGLEMLQWPTYSSNVNHSSPPRSKLPEQDDARRKLCRWSLTGAIGHSKGVAQQAAPRAGPQRTRVRYK